MLILCFSLYLCDLSNPRMRLKTRFLDFAQILRCLFIYDEAGFNKNKAVYGEQSQNTVIHQLSTSQPKRLKWLKRMVIAGESQNRKGHYRKTYPHFVENLIKLMNVNS